MYFYEYVFVCWQFTSMDLCLWGFPRNGESTVPSKGLFTKILRWVDWLVVKPFYSFQLENVIPLSYHCSWGRHRKETARQLFMQTMRNQHLWRKVTKKFVIYESDLFKSKWYSFSYIIWGLKRTLHWWRYCTLQRDVSELVIIFTFRQYLCLCIFASIDWSWVFYGFKILCIFMNMCLCVDSLLPWTCVCEAFQGLENPLFQVRGCLPRSLGE